MKRGLTTANAIIVAVIVIGSIFAINLFSSLSGVQNISGDVVSSVGGFCGTKTIKTVFGTTKTYTYTCPSGSSCENSKCVATSTTPPTTPTTVNVPISSIYNYDMICEKNFVYNSYYQLNKPTTCIDTDNRGDLFVKGTTIYFSYDDTKQFLVGNKSFAPCKMIVNTDYCTDSKFLTEYYCTGTIYSLECQKGCKDGACIV